MKKKIIMLAAAFYLATTKRGIDDVLAFTKHDETGLCFFGEDWDNNRSLDSGTVGNVPCTPEVEAWIENHR
jgi:hypothetical protein